MTRQRLTTRLSSVCLTALIGMLGGCRDVSNTPGTAANGGTLSGRIEIDGSSTVYPVTELASEEFRAVAPRVKTTIGTSGTGGGFKKFCRGETDISDASRPITESEVKAAGEHGVKFIELPICFDAITVIIHPENTWAEAMTVADLKKIWSPESQKTVTRWNQVRPEWPNEPIVLFGPGTDSGTFDYFTEAIVGTAKSSRGDYNANEDDNILVQGVAGNKNALGYLGYSYYESNKGKLKAVAIDNGNGNAVKPSLENASNGSYAPLSRPLFIYVRHEAAQRPEVKAFVEFYLEHVPELAQEISYLPLPADAYTMVRQRFADMKTGTAFGGEPTIGLTVEQVLKRELKE